MFDFIHIGQGKCLSTLLQNRWAADCAYKHVHGMGLGNKLQNLFFSDPQGNACINWGQDTFNSGECKVLSYECFVFFGVSEESELQYKDLFFERTHFMAKHLNGKSKTAFMVVRNPMKWIASCHAQYIKYGGHKNLQDYFLQFKKNIVDNLNIKKIANIWNAEGFQLKLLPMELFVRDENSFWSKYEEVLSFRRPNPIKLTNIQDNITDHQNLQLKARLNEIVKRIILESKYKSTDQVLLRESEQLQNIGNQFLKWGIRRYFENSTDLSKSELCKLISLKPDPSFRSLSLDQATINSLDENCIDFLSTEDSFLPFIGQYRECLFNGL